MRVFSTACACASALVILAGCDEKKSEPTAPAAPSVSAQATAAPPASTPAAAATPPPAASAKPLAEKLKCETLLPEKVRQSAGFLNYKMTQQAACPDCGPTCNLVQPGKPFEGLAIAYTCNAPYEKAAADKLLDETKKELKKPVVLTVGRGGVMGEKDNGTFYSAVAFDDDSNCKVAIDWMRGDKKTVEPVVKMALANVKQADVDAARK